MVSPSVSTSINLRPAAVGIVLLRLFELLQVAVVVLAAVIHLYVYLYYLPFYSPFANQLHCVFATIFAWGTACLAFAQLATGSLVNQYLVYAKSLQCPCVCRS